MSNFKQFADKVHDQFNLLATNALFVVDLSNDQLWDTYLESFPAGTNEIFRTNTHHDCSCCRNFVKEIGGVVAIIDNKLVSVWDIDYSDLASEYQVVTQAMADLVTSSAIMSPYLRNANYGRKVSQIMTPERLVNGETIEWDHFHCIVPKQHTSTNKAEKLGRLSTQAATFKRSLEELSIDAITTVLELIDSNSLYRGEEHKTSVANFLDHKRAYDSSPNKQFYIWQNYINSNNFRGSVIGTLVEDLSSGVDLERAVASFESKVAPSNYKRSSALITPTMINQAVLTLRELELENAVERRHATLSDISVNDVLFADHSAQAVMKDSLTDLLMEETKPTFVPKKPKDIAISDFLTSILPKATSVSAFMENKHIPQLVNITAPVHSDVNNLFKWDNSFAWSYKGGVTDSISERVKAHGGNVTGDLRFSIQWNEQFNDQNNDLDAHCRTPNSHIYYGSKYDYKGGQLDVDIQLPKNDIAVENITWPTKTRMDDGEYRFYVYNFLGQNTNGFRAEIEFDGQVFKFDYPKSVRGGDTINVATVTLNKGKFTIDCHLDSTPSSKTVWGIKTQQLVPVDTIMLSPNYWESGNQSGNKHVFFMLRDCKNDEPTRGIYNEFLHNSLHKHRKVFEVLSSKTQIQPSDHQLAGIGFSTTLRKNLIVEVRGTSVNGTYNIKF